MVRMHLNMYKGGVSRRLAVIALLAWALCCALGPMRAFAVDGVVDTVNVNHLLGGTATASAYEDNNDKFKPDHAIDGKTDTRWSSSSAKPNKDDTTWLAVDLKQAAKLQFFDIQFEGRTVAVKPSNVKGFDIQYQTPGSDEWKLAKTVENVKSGDGYETHVRVMLDEPIVASKVRLTNFDIVAGDTQWNGVSVVELAAYTNEQAVTQSLSSVVKDLEQMGEQTIALDAASISLPEVPEGFSVQLNGADFEQVIGDDLSVVHPLVDKVVQVSWKVTKDGSDETAETKDIPYVVKGAKTQEQGKNAKPSVVPEIQEWFSDSTAKLSLDTVTAITYSDASLKAIAEDFADDYKTFTGRDLTIEQVGAKAGAFNFTLASPEGDALLGDEGYAMTIDADSIDVVAPAVTGNMYAMQTILQMYKLDTDGFPIGQMRDYPRFEVRGFMWDVARKPVSLDMMKNVARTMRYYKMNDFQVHLSDNLIFLEDYGAEENQWQAYSAFRLQTDVANAEGETPTAKDYSITKDQMRDFIQSERALGMNIVPEIDMPAHAVAFTKVWPELGVHNTRVTTAGNTTRSAIDHLDVTKPETMELIKDIFDDYTTGENEVFDDETVVHIGADEFIIPNGRPAYCNFYNDLVPHLKANGNTVRVWGSFDSSYLQGGGTEPGPEGIENVQMNIWSLGWANPRRMHDKGFDLINILDSYGYMVPNGGGNRGAYGDYLNSEGLYNSFDPNNFGGTVLPSGDKQVLGSAFAIWNDNIDTRASGLSEADEFTRFFDAMPVYAENNWAATGKEKGEGSKGYQNLRSLVETAGYGPGVNPYGEASLKGDSYEEFDFEQGLDDVSENGRDLTEGKNAEVENGKLTLSGGESYVDGAIDKISTGTSLSFDIELTEPACPGDILFEADAPYGTLDIRVMDDGRLGFTRELYNYYFDYKLPVGKSVHVEIVTSVQEATLKIDGEAIGTARGSFYNADAGKVTEEGITNATFTLPLQRIGSKTQAIAATMDNVVVKPAVEEPEIDEFNKKAWTATTNSQTLQGETAGGHIEHACDSDDATIWHSNWKDVTEGNADGHLSVTNPIYAEIDFRKGYVINQFSFTPRKGQNSGQVTEANLFIRTEKDGEWKQVAKGATFKADGSKKTISFDEQTVYGVRFEATKSNDEWVAVSEFDIANKPAPASTVYARGMSYVAAQDGSLDMSTGELGGIVTGSVEDADASDAVFRADVKPGSKVTLTATASDDMEFVGWFAPWSSEPLSEETSYEVAADYSVALEARFKRSDEMPTPPVPTTHTVTFMVDGELYHKVEVADGETVAAPQGDPVKDGYTFKGWYLNGELYSFETPVTSDLTLVAKFSKKDAPSEKPGEKPGQGSTQKPGSGLPQTGDSSMLVIGGVAVAAVAVISAGVIVRRRKQ